MGNKELYRLLLSCGDEELSDDIRTETMCIVCDKLVKVVDVESTTDSFHRTILEFEMVNK